MRSVPAVKLIIVLNDTDRKLYRVSIWVVHLADMIRKVPTGWDPPTNRRRWYHWLVFGDQGIQGLISDDH